MEAAKKLVSSYQKNLGSGAIDNGHASGGIARNAHEELILNQSYQNMDTERQERKLEQFCEAHDTTPELVLAIIDELKKGRH